MRGLHWDVFCSYPDPDVQSYTHPASVPSTIFIAPSAFSNACQLCTKKVAGKSQVRKKWMVVLITLGWGMGSDKISRRTRSPATNFHAIVPDIHLQMQIETDNHHRHGLDFSTVKLSPILKILKVMLVWDSPSQMIPLAEPWQIRPLSRWFLNRRRCLLHRQQRGRRRRWWGRRQRWKRRI